MTADPTANRTPGRPLLEVHDIHKRFGANEVLKGVSLQARAGDVIVTIQAPHRGKYSSGAGLTRQDVIGHQ